MAPPKPYADVFDALKKCSDQFASGLRAHYCERFAAGSFTPDPTFTHEVSRRVKEKPPGYKLELCADAHDIAFATATLRSEDPGLLGAALDFLNQPCSTRDWCISYRYPVLTDDDLAAINASAKK
jgi:hypothetical protein